MASIIRFTYILLLTTLFLPINQTFSQNIAVHSIRMGKTTEKEVRVVFDLSNMTPFKVNIDKQKRCVDIKLLDINKKPLNINTVGFVSTCQMKAVDKKNLLVSLGVEPGVEIKGAFFLKPSEISSYHRLVIDLEKPNSPTIMKKQLVIPPSPVVMPAPAQPSVVKKKVIVLDAGHGGADSGTIGRTGIYEKTVTLAMAKELKKNLVSTGKYEVFLTRDRDVFLKLRERVERARNVNADLFISLHADSSSNNRTQGITVYTLSEVASDKEAERLARKENEADLISGMDLTTETQEVKNILIDLAQRESMNLSSHFAQGIIRSIGEGIKLRTRPHRFAGFAVLTAPDIPSILIELGYLSNFAEEKLLKSTRYREKLAKVLSKAIDQYFIKRHI